MTVHIGFTGTRHGMTVAQKATIERLISAHGSTIIVAHHGDCVGADADFHAICRKLGVSTIVAHPPSDDRLRAFTDADEIRESKHYLSRNLDIIHESGEMFATPAEFTEQARGGTWWTVRRRRQTGRPIAVVLPDGRIAT